MSRARRVLLAVVAASLLPQQGTTGSFVGANEIVPDLVVHQNYYGTGGTLSDISVCVDVSVNPTLAIAAEPAVRNVVATFNRFQSLSEHTYAQWPNHSADPVRPDFETALLHEFMHANGLGHPQHASDPEGAGSAVYDATRSTDGANNVLDHLGDADGLPGSSDDARGDDVSLNWYVRGVNDPGVMPAVVDTTTMARDADGLPPGHGFAANGNSAVMAALGYPDSESAAHQGFVQGQVQRHLHHEDLAALRLARAGLDGLAGTADDYVSRAVYVGRLNNPQGGECLIVVRMDDNGGQVSFASTLVGYTRIGTSGHSRMNYPTRMRFNPQVDWYFTPGPNTTVQIVDAPDPSVGSTPYTVQVQVAKAAGNAMVGTPQGEVEVRDGPRDDPQTARCRITLSGGSGSCQIVPRVAGRRTLTADYLGWGGWDGGSATAEHDVLQEVVFDALTRSPSPSVVGAEVEFTWTLVPTPGGLPVNPRGDVVVKEAADCGAAPTTPAHQCSATLPANRCRIRFGSVGSRTLRLCYAGDATTTPATAAVVHDVQTGRATTTTVLAQTPALTVPFAPYTVPVQVRETPDLGGRPQGTVVVRDGPLDDPLTAVCTITLAGTAGETGSCVMTAKRAGRRTVVAEFAAQGQWAASAAQAEHVSRDFRIASHLPASSRVGEAVSVVVALDVRPFLDAPAPTGTIVVSDGVDQCEIVLPASECLWRGSIPGTRSLTASWSGDGNYTGGTSAPVLQTVSPAPDTPRQVSVPLSGYPDSNAASTASGRALSADGRFLVFSSNASNLVAGDSNGVEDVFVRDQLNGALRRVSTTADDAQGNGASRYPAISADGRYVSFQSEASNLVAGDGNDKDVFVKDLHSGAIIRATALADGSAPASAEISFSMLHSALSADGRYLAFATFRALIDGDTNGRHDIYVRDMQTGALDLVSRSSADLIANNTSLFPAISADGRHVAFASLASNLAPGLAATSLENKVFVKDRLTRQLGVASATASGEVADRSCNGHPAISADGRHVAFMCTSTNLPNGGGWTGERIFVKDMATGAIALISQALQHSNALSPAISADGRYVAFQQGRQGGGVGIFVRDRNTGAVVNHHVTPQGAVATDTSVSWEATMPPSLSADGRFLSVASVSTRLTPGDLNGAADVFVRDLGAGITVRASAASAGARNDGDSSEAVVSRDGRTVVFASTSSRLVAGDGNGVSDVFVHDRTSGTTVRVSTAADGTPGNGPSYAPAYADASNEVAFLSAASNLVPNDTNNKVDVFVKSLTTGAIRRASTAFGSQGTADALPPLSISVDGMFVAFTSADGSEFLGSTGDRNGVTDVVLIDRQFNAPAILSAQRGSPFVIGNAQSLQAAMSDDGLTVAFASDATNLLADGGSAVRDVFLFSPSRSQSLLHVSRDASGSPGNGHSEQPAVSPDGRYVAFVSDASNLVPNDTNGQRDVFLKEIDTGAIERVNTRSSGEQGSGGGCSAPSLGINGRFVGFVCAQDDLVAGDSNGLADYFVKDVRTGTIVRLSEAGAGVQADAPSRGTARALSDDMVTVFDANARTLTGLDTNHVANVFVAQHRATAPAEASVAIVGVSPTVPRPGIAYEVFVEVRGSGATPPGGRVKVMGPTAGICEIGVVPGTPSTARCAITTNSSGAHTLKAYYSGDDEYRSAVSADFLVEVPDRVVPIKPVIRAVQPGNNRATVDFYAGSNIGSPFRDYTATCGSRSGTSATSPIVLTGLDNGVAVSCTVTVRNDYGTSPPSDPAVVTPRGGSTTTIVAQTPNPSVVNVPYTVNVAVQGEGTPPPAGAVTLTDGEVSCTATLLPGSPSTGGCALSSTSRGSKTLVASYGGDAGSAPSSATAVQTVNALPGAPTLRFAYAGVEQAYLTFDPPSDTGGSPILDYTGTCGAQSTIRTASPITVTGLINRVEVECYVQARSAAGLGARSNTLRVTPADLPGPATITAAQPGDGTVTVTIAPPAEDGGSRITSYLANCGGRQRGAMVPTIQITGLTNGIEVECFAQARNAIGLGARSPIVRVTPRPLPSPPVLTAVQAGNASASVSFDPPADAATSAILDYTATCGTQSNTGTASPLQVAGLVNGEQVDCRVSARNASGSGVASNPLPVRPIGEPQAPALTAVQPGDGRLTVVFTAPANDGGSPILDYTATCGTQSRAGSASPLEVAGLTNGVAVACRVSARNAIGSSAASVAQQGTPVGPPLPPPLLAVIAGDGAATLQFSAPADDGGSPVLDYTARCAAQSTTGAGSPLRVEGLANGATVDCSVSARNAVGSSPPSNRLAVTPVPANTVPGAPTLLAAQPGDRQVRLSFAAPSDDGGSAVLDYTARCGDREASAADSPIVVSLLTNGVAVSCSVRARNPLGAGPASNALSATPATVPGAPLLGTVAALGSGARLSFSAPQTDGGSVVLDYVASCSPGAVSAVGAGSPIEVSGLAPLQSYRCRVQARNAMGLGAPSADASVIPGQTGSTADLAINKTNGMGYVNDADFVDYLITVRNAGPAAVSGARVQDALAPDFVDAAWTCVADAGAWCPPSGSGALDVQVDLPAQTAVRIRFAALPATPGLDTPISNTASVAAPPGVVDPQPGNNVATDGPDVRRIFRDGFNALPPAPTRHAAGARAPSGG